MNTHTITVPKTARYCVLGESQPEVELLWCALHGYGQLAPYFIRKFQSLEDDNNLIVAPEGLHRYYLEGSSGRVGASWMTKEERLKDIQDYVNYLDLLDQQVSANHQFQKKVILGFSQGCATASRWVSLGDVDFDVLVLYAGVFPPDLDFELGEEKLKGKQVILALGDQDPYINTKQLDQHQEFLDKKGINYCTLHFQGDHQIYPTVLKDIRNMIK